MTAATLHLDDTTVRRRRFFQIQRSLVRRVASLFFLLGAVTGGAVAMTVLAAANG